MKMRTQTQSPVFALALVLALAKIVTTQAFTLSPSQSLQQFKRNARVPTKQTTIRGDHQHPLMMMMDVSPVAEVASSSASAIMFSSFTLAETEAWVKPVAAILDPLLNLMSFAMLCRVVLSWYPNININQVPFIFVTWPTQNLLRLVRDVIPPAFGVDITPIFWLAIFTFIHEILLGQQGLFTLKIQYGI